MQKYGNSPIKQNYLLFIFGLLHPTTPLCLASDGNAAHEERKGHIEIGDVKDGGEEFVPQSPLCHCVEEGNEDKEKQKQGGVKVVPLWPLPMGECKQDADEDKA